MAPTLRGCTFHTQPSPASLGFFGSWSRMIPSAGSPDHRAVRQQRRERPVIRLRNLNHRSLPPRRCHRHPRRQLQLQLARPPVSQVPRRRLQHQIHPVAGDQVALLVQVRRHPHPPHVGRLHQRQVWNLRPQRRRRRLKLPALRPPRRAIPLPRAGPAAPPRKVSANNPPPAAPRTAMPSRESIPHPVPPQSHTDDATG